MEAKDLVIGFHYRYDGGLVRLVKTRIFHTAQGERTVAIIEHPQYQRLWVKPEELEECS